MWVGASLAFLSFFITVAGLLGGGFLFCCLLESGGGGFFFCFCDVDLPDFECLERPEGPGKSSSLGKFDLGSGILSGRDCLGRC